VSAGPFADGFDLVTGGAGFIGSHLVDRLREAGRQVRVVDNFATGGPHNLAHRRDDDGLELLELDIRDREAVATATRGAERVFHLAAMADIVPSIQQPNIYFDANVTGTFNVLEGSRAAGVQRFLYAASGSCYGIPDAYPTSEEAQIRPQYPYALSKYLGEETVLHWGQVYGLSVISLRFFNVYGPRSRTSGAYGAMFGVFLAQLLAGEPITIVGDGTQSRDFTFVSDVAEALATAAASDASGLVLNVATGQDVSVNRIVELLGAGEVTHIPKRPGEPDQTLADVSRIQATLGWSAKVGIDEGVAIMLDNIDYWRDAPVWTPDRIAEATRDWFKYLADD
jgi:UDP-glucose 4-epimerase